MLAVTEAGVRLVSGSADPTGASWPSVDDPSTQVPVIFWGRRVPRGAEIQSIGLDDVAPTLARLIDFDVPHPEVRSGRPVAGVGTGPRPRLLLQIVVRGIRDIDSDPVLDALAGRGASGDADVGSLPADPAALMTTIGTGGVPAEHGITGTVVRNDRARVATAWYSPELDTSASSSGVEHVAPRSIIATLADDLDEVLGQRPKIGLVADTYQARGLVGGNWYVDNDEDSVAVVPTRQVLPTLRKLLREGFGRDTVPDLIGISLRAGRTDGATGALHILRLVEKAVGDRFAAAIVALPAEPEKTFEFPARDVARAVNTEIGYPVVETDTAGGFFLDQKALASAGVTTDSVADAIANDILETYGTKTDKVFADVFPGLAVAFARFC